MARIPTASEVNDTPSINRRERGTACPAAGAERVNYAIDEKKETRQTPRTVGATTEFLYQLYLSGPRYGRSYSRSSSMPLCVGPRGALSSRTVSTLLPRVKSPKNRRSLTRVSRGAAAVSERYLALARVSSSINRNSVRGTLIRGDSSALDAISPDRPIDRLSLSLSCNAVLDKVRRRRYLAIC